jgi:hypothetical protein
MKMPYSQTLEEFWYQYVKNIKIKKRREKILKLKKKIG